MSFFIPILSSMPNTERHQITWCEHDLRSLLLTMDNQDQNEGMIPLYSEH